MARFITSDCINTPNAAYAPFLKLIMNVLDKAKPKAVKFLLFASRLLVLIYYEPNRLFHIWGYPIKNQFDNEAVSDIILGLKLWEVSEKKQTFHF